MYTLRYLKNIKRNKTTKYTDSNSDGYNVEKRNLFLSQKKKFARKLKRFALDHHLKRKTIWFWKNSIRRGQAEMRMSKIRH